MPEGRCRVVYLTHTLGVGGAEELMLNLIARLPRDRYDAFVGCFEDPPGPMGAEMTAKGATVTALGIVPGLRHPLALWRIVSFLRRVRPDIVHTFMLPASLYGRAAAILARVPVVIGTEVNIYERKRRHHILAERLLTWGTNVVVASAESVKRAYVQQLGIRDDAVRVIYNAVNWDKLQTTKPPEEVRAELGVPSDRVVVGVIATLQDKKGHQVLFEACARTPGLERAWLMLVGDGPLRATLEQSAASLGIRDRVTFCGTRRDLGNVLAAMDIFALPSLWEGLPLALLLAMGAGKPVVATRLAGIPEVIVDGETGVLVPPGDAGAIGGAIAGLVADAGERRRMGMAARASVTPRFGADAYVKSITALYEECLQPAS